MIGVDPLVPQCSRAGCDADATFGVHWRNPKLHTPDRIKTWLACDEHVDYLREFLLARNFPVVVAPFGVEVTSLETEAQR